VIHSSCFSPIFYCPLPSPSWLSWPSSQQSFSALSASELAISSPNASSIHSVVIPRFHSLPSLKRTPTITWEILGRLHRPFQLGQAIQKSNNNWLKSEKIKLRYSKLKQTITHGLLPKVQYPICWLYLISFILESPCTSLQCSIVKLKLTYAGLDVKALLLSQPSPFFSLRLLTRTWNQSLGCRVKVHNGTLWRM